MAWWHVRRFLFVDPVSSCLELRPAMLMYPICSDPVKQQALKFYMDNFDFSGLRLDSAFRYVLALPCSQKCSLTFQL